MPQRSHHIKSRRVKSVERTCGPSTVSGVSCAMKRERERKREGDKETTTGREERQGKHRGWSVPAPRLAALSASLSPLPAQPVRRAWFRVSVPPPPDQVSTYTHTHTQREREGRVSPCENDEHGEATHRPCMVMHRHGLNVASKQAYQHGLHFGCVRLQRSRLCLFYFRDSTGLQRSEQKPATQQRHPTHPPPVRCSREFRRG